MTLWEQQFHYFKGVTLIIRRSTRRKKKKKKDKEECICEEREERYDDDYFPDIKVDEKAVEIYWEITDWKGEK